MGNVIDSAVEPMGTAAHVGRAFLTNPEPHSHVVQFYEDDAFLVDTVAHFVAAGLSAGDRVLVIATEEHRAAFAVHVAGADAALASGQLTMVDARETLACFMASGEPDPGQFRDVVERLLTAARGDAAHPPRVRAYGEMVDLLFREGRASAALRLEELWNDLGKELSFELLCAYVMGHFYKEGDAEHFMEVCRNHTHVLPTERFAGLDDPHERLREISFLQQRAHALEAEVRQRKELESELREALRERSRIEVELRAAASRERKARAAAEASDRFKDLFVGMLGHDLRNPLNTILTTVRIMARRGDFPPDAAKRFARVVTSGVRMERMIDQLLDVTRVRVGEGIPLNRAGEQDVTALVSKIADELRTSHHGREIKVVARTECRASIDPDRVEQVVSNLVRNALRHGDASSPVDVTVYDDDTSVRIAVHNVGAPIDPSLFAMLFDPFQRGHAQLGHGEGLGLGLYISQQIVAAHGGRITVASSAETGTVFEAIFPRGDERRAGA